MKRRDFLKASGCFIVTASAAGMACGDDSSTGQPDALVTNNSFSFPQGVASGDPTPSSVMLWTRAEAEVAVSPINVTVEVSASKSFGNVIVSETVALTGGSDFSLRMLVEGLSPSTWYYYRFRAGDATSDIGRTRTAPAADANEQVNLAWVSCQDYSAGLYDAWRQMIDDDKSAAGADQIQFVLHVGDFIYETIGSGFQDPLDDSFQAVELKNRDGSARELPPFPSGGGVVPGDDGTFAASLNDYRHLYRSYLSDPNLREARARWPFICTWDDHEFTNDCWQSQANYDESATLAEPSETRKIAANQAWFEYVPANLTGAGGVAGVDPEAADFEPANVSDAPFTTFDDNGFATDADNVAAVGSMTIYRSFRYGANVELLVTDLRSYRSDHAIPEELTASSQAFFDPRNALPKDMVNIMDAGRTANGGNPPDDVLGFPNARKNSPPGTMMGADQKQWFKDSLMGLDATWKVWSNEVPLFRFLVRQGPIAALLADRLADCDSWDGYNTERKELMKFIGDNQIANVVSFSGDVHAAFAGYVMDDYDLDAGNQTPVMVDFTAAGISSNSLFSFYEKPTRSGAVASIRPLVTYDATANPGGAENFIENINCTLLYGSYAANDAAATKRSDSAAKTAIDNARATYPDANPHLLYADANSQGYGLAKITANQIEAEIVTMERPIDDQRGPTVKRSASFAVPNVAAGQAPTITGPTFTGTKPWPVNLG